MPYPIVVNLQGKRCVVVGAGGVAERRVLGLLAEDAQVCIVAPQATESLAKLSDEGKIKWERGAYSPRLLEGAVLVFTATDNPEVNAEVARDAQAANTLVCRADQADQGSFITPAAIQRGDLLIAVATGGNSPTLAAVLRERLAAEFGPEWAAWTDLFGRLRGDLKEIAAEDRRRQAVKDILEDAEIRQSVAGGDITRAEELAQQCLLTKSEGKG